MIVAMLACGARPYELVHFRHEDYHPTNTGAYMTGGCKTYAGRNRVMPILDFGIPAFEQAYASSKPGQPLFGNPGGGMWDEHNWRNRNFYPYLDRLGIQENPYDETGHRRKNASGKLAKFTPYTCRHTYASLCNRAGVSRDILKKAIGHTANSDTLEQTYLHQSADEMRSEFQKADQLIAKIRNRKGEAT